MNTILDFGIDFNEENFPREAREALYQEIAAFLMHVQTLVDNTNAQGLSPNRTLVALPLDLALGMAFTALYFVHRHDEFNAIEACEAAILDKSVGPDQNSSVN